MSQFEIFASDQPLDTSTAESNFVSLTDSIDRSFDASIPREKTTHDSGLWAPTSQPFQSARSSGIGGDEAWELEDHGEEKMTPLAAVSSRLSAAFNDEEFAKPDLVHAADNFFSDTFNPSLDEKHPRASDNLQETSVVMVQHDDLDESNSSTSRDSEELEMNSIVPTLTFAADHTDQHPVAIPAKVRIHLGREDVPKRICTISLQTERIYESAELSPAHATPRSASAVSMIESDDLSPVQPPLHSTSAYLLWNKSFISPLDASIENIPLKSALLSSNTDAKQKLNLRSESELPSPTSSIVDSKLRSSTDTQLARPFESGKLILARGVISEMVRRREVHCFRLH